MNQKQKIHLRRQAHALQVVVIIGQQGLTDAVLNEINEALLAHELIKVRVNAEDHAERDVMIEKICTALSADLIQKVGHIAVIYREAEEE